MKLKFGTRKLTFMVIRDAHKSVIRFRLRSIFLYLIPAVILISAALSAGAIYTLSKMYQETLTLSQQLQHELREEVAKHRTILQQKDQTIEQLMNDVVELSTQTEQVQEKLGELQQISDQIKSINGEPSAAATDPDRLLSLSEHEGDVVIASINGQIVQDDAAADPEPYARSFAFSYGDRSGVGESGEITLFDGLLFGLSYLYDMENGRGGLHHDVTPEEILQLAQDTKADLALIEERMSDLKIDLEEAKEIAIEYQHMLRTTPSIWPTNSTRITSNFGYRRDPFTRRLSYHSGIDLGGRTGDPVYVTADGKVINSSYNRTLGHHIMVDHGNGLRTVYAHLSKRLVKVGDTVDKGEEIGKLGSTGRSTGPHLHYEVYKNGVAVNPKNYLP